MRKQILFSAIILGSIASQAGNFSFVGEKHCMELINGKQIEIILQQEVPDEDLSTYAANQQQNLTRQVFSHQRMLQILNQISREEQAVNEELTL